VTTKVLFVCSQNKWRSPTAEQIFGEQPGLVCASAGLNHDAENPLTPELVEWADLIFVMERAHKARLSARFREHLLGTRVICLGIPDRYRFMDPALVKLFKAKVPRFLPHVEVERGMTLSEGIARGEKAIEEGRTVTHAQAKQRMARWLK
jgi:predicted protein tyrosine phosphatase